MNGTRKPAILIVGLNYGPEPVGIGPYTTAMAESLAARGWKVEVIAGVPYYPQWRRQPGYRGLWHTTQEGGVTVTRCTHYVPPTPTGLKRVMHLASFALSALLPGVRAAAKSPDVVLCIVPALLTVPIAWLAARCCRAKLWIHVQDFEVEAAFATGLLNGAGLYGRMARRLEDGLLRQADRVSSISPQMVAKLIGKGIPPSCAVEIRNWSDDRFAVRPPDRLRREWGLEGRHIALYSGNIANKQGIEILIEAARHLAAARDDIIFVICGEGPNRGKLEQLAQGLANVRLYNLQPADRMGELLGLAEIHILPQIAGAADLVLPSKLSNMLASGRPVVATTPPQSGLANEIAGCGIVTPPGDAASLARAIVRLVDDQELRKVFSQAAVERAAARWSRGSIINLLEDNLLSLVDKSILAKY